MARPQRFEGQKMAVCYCRVSTDEQADGHWSIDVQKARTCAIARLNFPELKEEVIVDVGSARSDRRAGYRRLQGLVGAGQVGAVIVVDLDRLCRSLEHFLQLLRDLDKRAIALHAGGQGIDTSTPMGRLIAQLLIGVAEFESRMTSARVVRCLAAAKAAGKKGPGLRPYGWKVGAGGILERDEDEQRAIDLAMAQRARNQAWSRVAEVLNDAGFRTVTGGQWTQELARGVMVRAIERRAAAGPLDRPAA